MVQVRSFVALGDSFTEGVGDPSEDGGGCRGWADRFAEHLAAREPGLRYANLAIRGKLLTEVLDEQVPPAVEMGADLVSIAAGGNDLLRPSTDPDDLAVTLDTAVAALTGAGSTVMVFTGFDPKAFPVLRLIRGKSAVLTMHVREIAARYKCLITDLWTMRILTDRRLWTPDRLHLTPDGHRRVALLASEVAGLRPSEDWRAPLLHCLPGEPGMAGAAASWIAARWNDVEWIFEHAAPYLSRRLHGVSSGDGIVPKRPELTEVRPAAAGLRTVPQELAGQWAGRPAANGRRTAATAATAAGVPADAAVKADSLTAATPTSGYAARRGS